MLEPREVDQIANKAASAVLKSAVSRVFSHAELASDGLEAIKVTVVLTNEAYPDVTGDLALDTMVRVGRDLTESGEDRLALVRFATESEMAEDAALEASGNTQS